MCASKIIFNLFFLYLSSSLSSGWLIEVRDVMGAAVVVAAAAVVVVVVVVVVEGAGS